MKVGVEGKLQELAGDAAGALDDDRAQVGDLTAIRRFAIQGRDGLYLYDGNAMTLAPGSSPELVGAYYQLLDLPSIGHAFIRSDHGLFDVRSDRGVRRVVAPFKYAPMVWDLPQARAALANADGRFFALDVDLEFRPLSLPGPPGDTNLVYVKMLPSADALLATEAGFFLATPQNDAAHCGR
jgi:hypothetical protein